MLKSARNLYATNRIGGLPGRAGDRCAAPANKLAGPLKACRAEASKAPKRDGGETLCDLHEF